MFASHRLEEIDQLADRAVALELGQVTAILQPEALRRQVAPEVDMLLWIPVDQHGTALAVLQRGGWLAHLNGRGTIVVRTSAERKLGPIMALTQGGVDVLDAGLE